MKSADIRKKFLDFFKKKGHKIMPGSSLIPDDPTVLFALAGMLQFKPYFLGVKTPPTGRITTVQKCLRMVDIENVGKTGRHHTFFEMLGNFSFGDYFKREAIGFAWELLTKEFKIPKEKLLVAVFEKDDEAEKIWKEEIGIPSSKIHRLGEDNNFWAVGPTGPCGPCSEIYYDCGKDRGCGRPDCKPSCDCERFLEVWNLVFIEFNRDEEGNLIGLATKGIDTGMGLERVASVLQGVGSNFETDLFQPIIKMIISSSESKELDVKSLRIVADHIRAITHLISDGVIPSNDGRGYVLRRILRRAVRHARLLGLPSPFLGELSQVVIDEAGGIYKQLKSKEKDIKKYILAEENNFSLTLESGIKLIQDLFVTYKNEKRIPGEEAFKLHDTFGFPIDLTKEIALEAGFSVDEEGFNEEMEKQRERARTAGLGTKAKIDFELSSLKLKPTKFVGYETLLTDAKVLEVKSKENLVFLDKTPFYPEGGGQVGDKGSIEINGRDIKVAGTFGEIGGVIAHIVEDTSPFKKGASVKATVDSGKRHSTEKHHTATHILHKALRQILGENVRQSGSLVSPERLRFDYTVESAPSDDKLASIERIVNDKIHENLKVETQIMGFEEAKKLGAMALFDEKYGNKVRVLKIGDFSVELCGGTHVDRTGVIELFKIKSDEAISAGVRRIEAIAGSKVIEYILSLQEELRRENTDLLCKLKDLEYKKERLGGTPLIDFEIFEITTEELNIIKKALRNKDITALGKFIEHLEERNGRLRDRISNIEKEIKKLLRKKADIETEELLLKAKEKNGVKFVISALKDYDMEILRIISDKIAERLASGVILLSSEINGRLIFYSMITDDLVKKGFNASEFVKEVARITQGGGGGKAGKAEAGGKDISKLDEALKKAVEIIEKKAGEIK